LEIDFDVADMRHVSQEHRDQAFDVVLACDNAIPHLLSEEAIRRAFRAFFQCTRPGGGCLISVRDYAKEDLSKRQIKPYGIREVDGVRWLLWQVWEPHGSTYDLTLYLVEDRGHTECRTHAFRTTYHAVGIPRLMALMREAGFEGLRRIDGRFFQPIIIGHKPRS
ncbi:MAG: class I SAM-dependent methyltransferase, partial [bacterium]